MYLYCHTVALRWQQSSADQTSQTLESEAATSPIATVLSGYIGKCCKCHSKTTIIIYVTLLLTQSQIHSNQLRRAEQEGRSLLDRVQTLTTQNKDLNVQLQEIKRRQAEIECKVHVHVCC